ncbi:methyl-accepting chemotaxis protein [Ectopseudomonas mendocina]|uniref:methyl-accepting chemotaxis protein n=1 Tax=Ectopseudomonas mendocina TaxID=300 RepID=UPI003EFD23D5
MNIKDLPLRLKITLTAAVLLSLVSITLIWQSVSSLDRTVNDTLQRDIDGFAQSISVNLGNWMHDRISAVKTTAGSLVAQPQIAPHILLQQTWATFAFNITYIGTTDGRMLQNDPSVILKNYDPRQRGWYQGAEKNNDLFISDPYVSLTDGAYVVTIAYPARRDGSLIGVVGANLTLDTLTDTIGKLSIPGDGYALLIDQSGQMIAHPDKDWRTKSASDFSPTLGGEQLKALVQQRRLTEADVAGSESLLFAVEIPNTRWTFVMVMDKATVLAPVRHQLFVQLAIGAGMLILAILVLALLGRVLFRDLEQIRRNLNAIAAGNGDLTQRLPVNSNDEIGQLSSSFNRFIDQLHGIISRLRDVAVALSSESAQVAQDADAQNQRVQQHQSELHLVATAVTQMASATQEISRNAETASGQAVDSVSLSVEGRRQVERSQESISLLAEEVEGAGRIIDELHRHSNEISSILSTIASIADQTNLLALNAAIEAARAGEHGRGFSVVADEVRVLSKRTHESTREIEAMIQVLQDATRQAVGVMDNAATKASQSVTDAQAASDLLQRITEAVGQINDMAAQIASAAEEQASVTVEVNRNTENIRSMGDQMSQSSHAASAAASNLQALGRQIGDEVSKFVL